MKDLIDNKTLTDLIATVTFYKWVSSGIGGGIIGLVIFIVKFLLSTKKSIITIMGMKLSEFDKAVGTVMTSFRNEVVKKQDEIFEHIESTTLKLEQRYDNTNMEIHRSAIEVTKLAGEIKGQKDLCQDRHAWDGKTERRQR